MKTLLTLFVLLFTSPVLAKEYQSIHGFKASIPDDYIVVTSYNFDELTDLMRSTDHFNMDFWDSIVVPNLNLNNQNIELLINMNNSNFIDFISNKHPYTEFNETFLTSYCPGLKKSMSVLAKRNVEQIICEISSNPGIVGNSVYSKHYGIFPGVTRFHYLFYIDYENFIDASLTCFFEDCVVSKLVFEGILFSINE